MSLTVSFIYFGLQLSHLIPPSHPFRRTVIISSIFISALASFHHRGTRHPAGDSDGRAHSASSEDLTSPFHHPPPHPQPCNISAAALKTDLVVAAVLVVVGERRQPDTRGRFLPSPNSLCSLNSASAVVRINLGGNEAVIS